MDDEYRPYRDPAHPGNALRADVRCIGCDKHGVVTFWGPWCFECNVERMDRISDALSPVSEALGRGPL